MEKFGEDMFVQHLSPLRPVELSQTKVTWS